MNCRTFHEAIVDYARGVLVGPGTRAAVESHLEHCGDCSAEFERQQQLTHRLRQVADASAGEEGSDELERRLVAQFVAMRTQSVRLQSQPRWMAYAAAVVVLAAGSLAAIMTRHSAAVRSGEERAPKQMTQGAVPVDRVGPRVDQTPPVSRETESGAREVASAASAAGRSVGLRHPATPRPARLSVDDFMPLPGAVGLPAFESGRVVRVELPVSALPTYGVEVVPDAVRSDVEADLLVGQDGQPRAIRLVNRASESRSRQ